MHFQIADTTYDWIDHWATPPNPTETATSWPHSAITWSKRRELWTYHPARPAIISFDPEGRFLRSFPCPLLEAHGMTLVEERGQEYLWMADASRKRRPELDYRPSEGAPSSGVLKTDLNGHVLLTLDPPPHPAYRLRALSANLGRCERGAVRRKWGYLGGRRVRPESGPPLL